MAKEESSDERASHGVSDDGSRTSSEEACEYALEGAEGDSELGLSSALSAQQGGARFLEEVVKGGIGDSDTEDGRL